MNTPKSYRTTLFYDNIQLFTNHFIKVFWSIKAHVQDHGEKLFHTLHCNIYQLFEPRKLLQLAWVLSFAYFWVSIVVSLSSDKTKSSSCENIKIIHLDYYFLGGIYLTPPVTLNNLSTSESGSEGWALSHEEVTGDG